MQDFQIVAFMGERKSGKDYLCDYLKKTCGAKRLSFSDEVRRLAKVTFPWMEFDYPPESKDAPIEHPENPNHWTPRDIWLHVGKARDVDGSYFARRFVENQYLEAKRQGGLYVITDFRTPEEWEFLKSEGIPVIKITCDRTGIEDQAFEEYTRQFDKATASFFNQKNGTEGFQVFWNWFHPKFLKSKV